MDLVVDATLDQVNINELQEVDLDIWEDVRAKIHRKWKNGGVVDEPAEEPAGGDAGADAGGDDAGDDDDDE